MKRKKLSAPLTIDISLTDMCNLNCTYCYANAGAKKHNTMKYKNLKKLIKEIENIGTHYVRIAGGEPTLHPNYIEILNICGNSKFLSSMSTNATLIDKKEAQLIKASNIDWVVVSLDGHNEDIHNKIRGKFSKTIEGINNLVNEKIDTKLACVVTNNNIEYINDIIDKAKKLKVSSIGLIIYSSVGRASDNLDKLKIPKFKFKEFILKINSFKKNPIKNLDINVVFPHESKIPWELSAFLSQEEIEKYWNKKFIGKEEREISCYAGISTCAIDALGNVFGCEQLMGYPELIAGNIYNNTLKDIWNDSKVLNKIRELRIEDLHIECKECEFIGCGGGCRAIAYATNKNLLAKDNSCVLLLEDKKHE